MAVFCLSDSHERLRHSSKQPIRVMLKPDSVALCNDGFNDRKHAYPLQCSATFSAAPVETSSDGRLVNDR
jgi:hypothetical protein